jgi:hypothetical protein
MLEELYFRLLIVQCRSAQTQAHLSPSSPARFSRNTSLVHQFTRHLPLRPCQALAKDLALTNLYIYLSTSSRQTVNLFLSRQKCGNTYHTKGEVIT